MYSTQFKAIFFYMYTKNNYNSNACPEVTDTTPNAPSIDPEPPSD